MSDLDPSLRRKFADLMARADEESPPQDRAFAGLLNYRRTVSEKVLFSYFVLDRPDDAMATSSLWHRSQQHSNLYRNVPHHKRLDKALLSSKRSFLGLPMLHPSSYIVRFWNVLILLLDGVYTAGWVPVTAAFNLPRSVTSASGATDFVFGIILCTDVLVRFHAPIILTSPFKTIVLQTPRAVAHFYVCRGSFFIDMLAAVPLVILPFVRPTSAWVIAVLFFRILRIVRVRSVLKALAYAQMTSTAGASGWRLMVGSAISTFYTILVMSHFMACLWYWTGTQSRTGINGWLAEEYKFNLESDEAQCEAYKSNLVAEGRGDLVDDVNCSALWFSGSKFYFWGVSMYFIIITLTTIGYGDITPTTPGEIVVELFVVVGGLALFASILGSITEIVHSSSQDAQRASMVHNKLGEVQRWLTAHELSAKTRKDVVRFYAEDWGAAIGDDEVIISELPADIAGAVVWDMVAEDFAVTPLWSALSLHAKASGDAENDIEGKVEAQKVVAAKMVPVCSTRGTHVAKQGDDADTVYFLQRGEVEVLHLGRAVARIAAPSTFGEAALLRNELSTAEQRLSGYRTTQTSLCAPHPQRLLAMRGRARRWIEHPVPSPHSMPRNHPCVPALTSATAAARSSRALLLHGLTFSAGRPMVCGRHQRRHSWLGSRMFGTSTKGGGAPMTLGSTRRYWKVSVRDLHSLRAVIPNLKGKLFLGLKRSMGLKLLDLSMNHLELIRLFLEVMHVAGPSSHAVLERMTAGLMAAIDMGVAQILAFYDRTAYHQTRNLGSKGAGGTLRSTVVAALSSVSGAAPAHVFVPHAWPDGTAPGGPDAPSLHSTGLPPASAQSGAEDGGSEEEVKEEVKEEGMHEALHNFKEVFAQVEAQRAVDDTASSRGAAEESSVTLHKIVDAIRSGRRRGDLERRALAELEEPEAEAEGTSVLLAEQTPAARWRSAVRGARRSVATGNDAAQGTERGDLAHQAEARPPRGARAGDIRGSVFADAARAPRAGDGDDGGVEAAGGRARAGAEGGAPDRLASNAATEVSIGAPDGAGPTAPDGARGAHPPTATHLELSLSTLPVAAVSTRSRPPRTQDSFSFDALNAGPEQGSDARPAAAPASAVPPSAPDALETNKAVMHDLAQSSRHGALPPPQISRPTAEEATAEGPSGNELEVLLGITTADLEGLSGTQLLLRVMKVKGEFAQLLCKAAEDVPDDAAGGLTRWPHRLRRFIGVGK